MNYYCPHCGGQVQLGVGATVWVCVYCFTSFADNHNEPDFTQEDEEGG